MQRILAFQMLLVIVVTSYAVPVDRPKKDPDANKIPLKSIWATTGQEKLIPVIRGFDPDAPFEADLQYLNKNFSNLTMSSVFLVQGESIRHAISATRNAFGGYYGTAKYPIPPVGDARFESNWMVVYFGTAQADWVVHSVELVDFRIRMVYEEKQKVMGTSGGAHQYFIWVPLGRLPAGSYSLEVVNVKTKEIDLSRRVTVMPKKN